MIMPHCEQRIRGKDSRKALLIIRGFLSTGPRARSRDQDWTRSIERSDWQGDVWQLHWDASESAAILARMLQAMVRFRGDWRLIATSTLAAALHHWITVRRRAEEIGRRYFGTVICQTFCETQVTIVAHSAGARLAFYGLRGTDLSPWVRDVVFLGAAVSRGHGRDWGAVVSHIQGNLINVYNPYDWVLCVLYRLAQLTARDACGRAPVLLADPRIINWNAASIVGKALSNHENYLTVLPTILANIEHHTGDFSDFTVDTLPELC